MLDGHSEAIPDEDVFATITQFVVSVKRQGAKALRCIIVFLQDGTICRLGVSAKAYTADAGIVNVELIKVDVELEIGDDRA